MDIKGLIFDLDGVIVNTEHNHFIAWKRTADSLGVAFTEKDNEKLKGLSRVDSLKTILSIGNTEISEETFNDYLVSKNKFYLDSIASITAENMLKGVADLLLRAKEKGILLAVGSSSKNAKFILERLNLIDSFHIIVDGNMVQNPKPNPEVFLKGAEAMGFEPAECVVFEDAESGIKAAKDGGFYSIAVGNPEIAALGDLYLNDLTEFKLI
jgi:beta-phosphoglucomutase